MTGIDEVVLCDNKAKNVGIATVTTRLFNEVSVQKNESEWAGYFITIPKYHSGEKHLIYKVILTSSIEYTFFENIQMIQ